MLKSFKITFPAVFEILVWIFYVSIYKYSYRIEHSGLPHQEGNNFPYLEICLYSIFSTLYLVPYYRWAVPRLLEKKRYWLLFCLTAVSLSLVSVYNNAAIAWIFQLFKQNGITRSYFAGLTKVRYVDLDLALTDLLAFFCVAFARYSYKSELKRHSVETDHLKLQLNMLKTQLQPHFLFNTLNGLYGMSLTGSKDTPRFILLLSNMMQYILYDCDKEFVSLADEIDFLKGYFELEQKKYPSVSIELLTPANVPDIQIPPLLFLPLVENSFKHGKHKLTDNATVMAELKIHNDRLSFSIINDMMGNAPVLPTPDRVGGIGLVNVKRRLELYYRGMHQFITSNADGKYVAEILIELI
ncbi:sensor histidine kinase [Mucilaginibacter daejeonensis]|uniref:sensor histidine kinase n=1 Tax=Mucilaginibacter daejeonensis TaxID=398049 RepID=UPI001D17C1CB|nr:sensor histidine kinase [Mucilaginibacter daejeonensis]UEG51920.1 sensor histidine kinase [Mucilaginibacter daejeonensis]